MSLESPRLVLASASPRRAELLERAGIAFVVDPAAIDESILDGESPSAYAMRVSEAKARVVHGRHPAAVVLAADTIVVVDGAILGKPRDEDDARRMLRLLSGRTHDVLTAIYLMRHGLGQAQVVTTQVDVGPLTEEEIAWYVATGEPRDKAGAYAIQGLASRFVTGIHGSYSNVVGLPVSVVYALLQNRPTSAAEDEGILRTTR
jgi:septum formation protein